MSHAEDTCSQLMQRAQAGEQIAYHELLEACAGMIRAYVMVRTGSRDAAEDITQETLMSIHRARHTFDPAKPFLPWMYAIARHRLIDNRRIQSRIRLHEATDEHAVASYTSASAGDSGQQDDLGADALAAAGELPTKQREVITLLKLKDNSVKEAASKLRMSESAVKVTAHRAYVALRRRFGVSRDED